MYYCTSRNKMNSRSSIVETELPFDYRARAWARCTQVFCISDPFVLEHEQHYRFLYELHWEVRSRLLCVKSVTKIVR